MSIERAALAKALAEVAHDPALMEIGRKAVEDALIEWRDSCLFTLRRNGLAIRNHDGTDSSIIRFGPEVGCQIALMAIAEHLEAEVSA